LAKLKKAAGVNRRAVYYHQHIANTEKIEHGLHKQPRQFRGGNGRDVPFGKEKDIQ
jgi:hypothetical protein